MERSIENIWKEGFINEGALKAPIINDIYNQKSKHLIDRVLKRLRIEVWLLLPMAVAIFALNLALDNNTAVYWGIISALPCLLWFFVGQRQMNSLRDIPYGADCYEYLLCVKQKVQEIANFNKRLIITSIPILLFPMLIYTYFNNQGKTIGQVFGFESVHWHILTIFLFLPVAMVGSFIVAEISFRWAKRKSNNKIDMLIREMEELRGKG